MHRFIRRLVPIFLFGVLISGPNAFADQTSVRIEAPASAPVGSDITVSVHVTHEGNSFFHFTDWVWLKADDKEIGRWEFKADQRPENEIFTLQVRYRLNGPVVFTAQGNCNLHGSAGAARAEVAVADSAAPAAAQAVRTTAPPAGGGSTLGWFVSVLGVVNLLLCGFQVATGRRWLKVKIAVHRSTGQALLALALLHGGLAMLMNW